MCVCVCVCARACVFLGPASSIGHCQKSTKLSWSMISPPTHTPYDLPDATGTQLSQPMSFGPGGVLPRDQNSTVNTLRSL